MFDPFSEAAHNKQRRRKSSEVLFDKKQWADRVGNHFKRAMEELRWPKYVKAPDIWDCTNRNANTNLPRQALARNALVAMKKLGYVKMANTKSGDGRWNFSFGPAVVYRRKSAPPLDKWAVKDVLGV